MSRYLLCPECGNFINIDTYFESDKKLEKDEKDEFEEEQNNDSLEETD